MTVARARIVAKAGLTRAAKAPKNAVAARAAEPAMPTVQHVARQRQRTHPNRSSATVKIAARVVWIPGARALSTAAQVVTAATKKAMLPAADAALPENAPPPPLAADGQAAAPEEPLADGVMEPPKMPEMSPDGQASTPGGGDEDGGSGEEKEEENKVQEIRGVLELKTPDQEDTPFLTLTYDFTKIPHAYRLAKDNGIFEYAYYKYKPMLVKAHQFIKRKQITRALNYYRVIREQQIPTEFRHMVDRNIKDITEYLQKYLVTRAS